MPELTMKYFVLKPRGKDIYARASRAAMYSYAKLIREKDPELSDHLREWASIENAEAYDEEMEKWRANNEETKVTFGE